MYQKLWLQKQINIYYMQHFTKTKSMLIVSKKIFAKEPAIKQIATLESVVLEPFKSTLFDSPIVNLIHEAVAWVPTTQWAGMSNDSCIRDATEKCIGLDII